MAWYDGTYSCGHEGRVNICGPTKDRQRKADWHFSGLCPECYKKHLEEEKERKNREAAEKSAELELPELTGTEKQIAWANTIRIKKIDSINARVEKIAKMLEEKGLEKIPGEDVGVRDILHATEHFAREHTDARYWIDHRDDDLNLKELCGLYKKHLDDMAHEDVIQEIEDEQERLTVSPGSEDKKPGIVKIGYDGSVISARYIKDADLIEIVKSLGYKWTGTSWGKGITEYTGDAADRIAELGNRLLLSGFTVQFPDAQSKEMAASGAYKPENDRWVRYDIKNGQIALVWAKRSDTLYDVAKKLPGARWKDGAMRVSIGFYKEVQDFAETMGFSISKKAQEEIERYKAKEAGIEVVSVAPADADGLTDEERIARSLRAGGTIIEDLIDG